MSFVRQVLFSIVITVLTFFVGGLFIQRNAPPGGPVGFHAAYLSCHFSGFGDGYRYTFRFSGKSMQRFGLSKPEEYVYDELTFRYSSRVTHGWVEGTVALPAGRYVTEEVEGSLSPEKLGEWLAPEHYPDLSVEIDTIYRYIMKAGSGMPAQFSIVRIFDEPGSSEKDFSRGVFGQSYHGFSARLRLLAWLLFCIILGCYVFFRLRRLNRRAKEAVS